MAEIEVFNRQEAQRIGLRGLNRFAAAAYEAVCAVEIPRGGAGPLRELERVEVTIVTDEVIARVHEEFMNDPSPTDVITFDHGEIVISAETAARQGAEEGTSCDREIALYIVHGLLHLQGYEDGSAAGAEEMRVLQERILGELCEG